MMVQALVATDPPPDPPPTASSKAAAAAVVSRLLEANGIAALLKVQQHDVLVIWALGCGFIQAGSRPRCALLV